MIKLLRIDDRLIHGQVAVSWTPYLDADTIVVANDAASTDKLMRSVFKLATPPQTVLSVKSVKGATLVINNPKHNDRKIFVVCSSPQDALEIVRECPSVRDICLGGIRKSNDCKPITQQVYLNADDISALHEMKNLGANIKLQSLPDQTPMDFESINKAFSK